MVVMLDPCGGVQVEARGRTFLSNFLPFVLEAPTAGSVIFFNGKRRDFGRESGWSMKI